MRLVIAGAGGRMGRTLIHAIAATTGVTLVGAVEAGDSAVIGRDAGELAGLGANGVKVVSDPAPLVQAADGLIEFTIPAATLALALALLLLVMPVSVHPLLLGVVSLALGTLVAMAISHFHR